MSDVINNEEEKFISELERRISRRRKEITSLNLGVAKINDSSTKFVFLRAAVALLYANWEGAVKESANLFLRFLDSQALDLSALRENYIVLLKPDGIEIPLSQAVKNARSQGNILEGTVNSKFLRKVCWQLSLDYQVFEAKEGFIDRMLGLRNRIVHGEEGQIGYDDFVHMAAEVQKLIDNVQDQFALSVNSGSYIR